MAYNKHNFTIGQALRASDMNEIDTQVKKNADDIENLKVNGGGSSGSAALENLTLEADSGMIYLMNNGVEISAVAIPDAGINGYVAAEGLSIDKTSLRVGVNKTEQLTGTATPSDSTQRVRYKANDALIASVDSHGVVTGKKIGSTTVDVLCGSHSKNCEVKVYANMISEMDKVCGYPNFQAVGDTASMNRLYANSENKFLCCWPYLSAPIKPGQKLTVRINQRNIYTIWDVFIIKPRNAEGFRYTGSWADGTTQSVENATLIEQSGTFGKNVSNGSGGWIPDGINEYVYTNSSSEDVYATVVIQPYNTYGITESMKADFQTDGAISIMIEEV